IFPWGRLGERARYSAYGRQLGGARPAVAKMRLGIRPLGGGKFPVVVCVQPNFILTVDHGSIRWSDPPPKFRFTHNRQTAGGASAGPASTALRPFAWGRRAPMPFPR